MNPAPRRGAVLSSAARSTLAGIALLAALTAVCGCRPPLPEEGSPQARLYAERCGSCHAAWAPASLGPAMWEFQLGRMDEKYRAAGVTPPTAAEREQILEYLTRHAGG